MNTQAPTTIAAKSFARVCGECGAPFTSPKEHAAFCCDGCRKAFNNRRMTRGAELYDLFMSIRYERGVAKALGLWSVLCKAAELFREEDASDRAGRKSWSDPKAIIERRPYLRSHFMLKPKK